MFKLGQGKNQTSTGALTALSEPQNLAGDHKFFLNWPKLAGYMLKFLAKLIKVRIYGEPDVAKIGAAIFAHWHCEDLSMLPHFGYSKATILISPSADGSILSSAVSVMGYKTTRGSSSKGALGGLMALKKCLQNGQNVILAVDGPRGPRLVAKPGALYLAAKTGAPIYACASAGSREYVFKKSWNRTRLQLPFSKLVVVFSPPIIVPPEAKGWSVDQQSLFLGEAILAAGREAEIKLQNWLNEVSV
ncbi:MAG: lysophospholipid acyltransferase family protein [Candidatus Adiutrix sp.]